MKWGQTLIMMGLYGNAVDFANARKAKQTLFTQFLFSFKLNPQTVFFLGYSDNYFGMNGLDITQSDRTFFVKIGYAWTK